MPGGQYTNLYQQAQAVGPGSRWHEICRMYAEVNQLFGDIVKVTPTSKVVGDMALFMVANNLTAEDVLDSKRELAFPESVVDLRRQLGQPPAAFRPRSCSAVLRGQKPLNRPPRRESAAGRFRGHAAELRKAKLGREPTVRKFSRISSIPGCSPTSRAPGHLLRHQRVADGRVLLRHGAGRGNRVDIEPGKTLIVKFLTVGDPHPDGRRTCSSS